MTDMWKWYETGDELVRAIGDAKINELRFDGVRYSTLYSLDDSTGIFELPIRSSCVQGAEWRQVSYTIDLPSKIETSRLHWTSVFYAAKLYCIHGNNTLSFGNYPVSVRHMFDGAMFCSDSPFSFEIMDSVINVGSMFYCSYGLYEVRFTDCELIGLRDLFVGSEVETVRFENCTIILDDDSINDYVGCASDVFAYHMTKLTMKRCHPTFITTILGMFDGVDGFENLEIEILD
jgi:hypothetical protein